MSVSTKPMSVSPVVRIALWSSLIVGAAGVLLGQAPAQEWRPPADSPAPSMSVNGFRPTFYFVDWMKSASIDSVSKDVPVTFDINGWPTSDCRIGFYGVGSRGVTGHSSDISGTYHLSFECANPDVEVKVTDVKAPQVVKSGYDAGTKRWSGEVTIPAEEGRTCGLALVLTNTNGGVRNLRMIRPGYPADTQEVVPKELKAVQAPFGGAFRPTSDQGQGTDAYPATREWASRKNQPSLPTWSGGSDGSFPQWEKQIAVANDMGRDLWINVPSNASDDYVLSLARLLKEGATVDGVTYPALLPNLRVYLEYSNEVWNFGFHGQFRWNVNAGHDDLLRGNQDALHTPPVGPKDPATFVEVNYLLRYAARAAQVSDLFRKVFGDAAMMTRVRPMLCWQENNGQTWLTLGRFVEQYFGPPSHFFYSVGCAEYVSPLGNSVDEMNADTQKILDKLSTEHWVQSVAAARTLGLHYLSYEGGGFNNYSKPAQKCQYDWLYDPRLKDHVARYWTDMFQAGSDGMAWTGLQGEAAERTGGAWGIVEDLTRPEESPRWAGTKEVAGKPRPSVTAGIRLEGSEPIVVRCADYKFNPMVVHPAWPKQDAGGANYLSQTPAQFVVLLNAAQAGTWQVTLTGSHSGPGTETVVEARLDGQIVENLTLGKGGDPAKDAAWAVAAQADFRIALTPGLHALEFRHDRLARETPPPAYAELRLKPVPDQAEPRLTPPTAPTAPRHLQAWPQKGRVLLTWDGVAPNGSPLLAYDLYRGGKEGDLTVLKKDLPADRLSFADTEVKDGEAYRYQVVARNAVGAGPRSPEASGGPIAPPAAQVDLKATPEAGPKPGAGQVRVTWKAPEAPVDYYAIYWSTKPGVPVGAAGVYVFVPGTKTEFLQISNGNAYSRDGITSKDCYYVISAVNGAGEGVRSLEIHVDLSAFVTTAPPAAQ